MLWTRVKVKYIQSTVRLSDTLFMPLQPQPLFANRNPHAGTDARFDALLEEAFRPSTANPVAVDTTRSAREFALAHGWPLPQTQARRKWLRCVLVILGAILATLLLGQLLEGLRTADQRPPVAKVDTSAITRLVVSSTDREQDSGIEVSGPVLKNPFADWAPRAVPAPRTQLVTLPVRRAELVRLPR
jgi:hypothetical protein